MTDNVVQLPQERSARLTKKSGVYGTCRHYPIVVDEHTRSVSCRDCGAALDPFDWIVSLAKREESELMAITGLRKQANELREDIDSLKKERAAAKSARDRAVIAQHKAETGGAA